VSNKDYALSDPHSHPVTSCTNATKPCISSLIPTLFRCLFYSKLKHQSWTHERASRANAALPKKVLNSLTCFRIPPSGLLLLTSPAMVLRRIERSGGPDSSASPPVGAFSSPRETASSMSCRAVESAACSCRSVSL
jgi:hypothetical protein